MVEHGVKRRPVVRQDRLVGMITRSDLVRAFARSDGDLEQEIEDVLHRLWIEPGSVTVSVRDGEARLSGVWIQPSTWSCSFALPSVSPESCASSTG